MTTCKLLLLPTVSNFVNPFSKFISKSFPYLLYPQKHDFYFMVIIYSYDHQISQEDTGIKSVGSGKLLESKDMHASLLGKIILGKESSHSNICPEYDS